MWPVSKRGVSDCVTLWSVQITALSSVLTDAVDRGRPRTFTNVRGRPRCSLLDHVTVQAIGRDGDRSVTGERS